MKTVFNILEYGASGDGCTMNTAAIAKAVAAVKAAGGGELYFPAGTYLSGTISAVDNLTIHLAPGATLLASGDFSDYVIARPGQYQSCEFISACDVENFTIYGAGSICGNGFAFWKTPEGDSVSWEKNPESEKESSLDLTDIFRGVRERPTLIRCYHCRNVKISDVSLLDSACYTVWALACTDLKISGVTIRNHICGPNTDGLDIDCCRKVMISNCNIKTCDDAIALKSDCFRSGVSEDSGVQDVTVTNCILWSRCCGIRVGYEGNAPITDCSFSNIIINHANHGIDLISVCSKLVPHVTRGARIERLRFSDITIRDAGIGFYLWAGNDPGKSEHAGWIREIDFFHIDCRSEETSFAGSDMPGKISDLNFHQVVLRVKRKVEWPDHSPVREDRMPSVWGGGYRMGGFRLLRTRDVRMDYVRIFSDCSESEVLVLDDAENTESFNCKFN